MSRFQRLLNGVADGVAEAISPKSAVRRRVLRQNSERMAELASAHASRFDGYWTPPETDANSQTIPDLPEVRRRARSCALNNAIYIAVRETMVQHVVGADGIQPRSSIDADRLGITTAQAEQWQGAVNDLWTQLSGEADVTGRSGTWGALQRLIYRSMFDGGDVFPTFPLQRWPQLGAIPRINLIEAERVDVPPEQLSNPRARGGVRVNAWGAPTGFWVRRRHPGDSMPGPDSQRFELWPRFRGGRANILQLYQQDRVGQARGIPRLASCIGRINQVEQYEDSTLIAAEMQTRFAMFIEAADPEGAAGAYGQANPAGGLSMDRYGDAFDHGVDSGSIHVLHQGDKIGTVGATHPSSFHDPFVIRLLRTISAVTKVPFSIAFGDTTGANYSSMRREFQSFKHTVACEQSALMPLCQTYWQLLLYEAWLDGRLLPGETWVDFGARPELWSQVLWSAPVLGNVDPTKETASDVQAIEAGIVSPQEVIRGRGKDPEAVLRERREWKDREDELDLQAAQPAPMPGTEDEQPGEDDQVDPLEQGEDQEGQQ